MANNRPSKILLTGFEPFGGEADNPAKMIVEAVANDPRFLGRVETLLLPVTFRESFQVLEKKLRENDYQFIICLGQAAGRIKISLERVALNLIDSSAPDENGEIVHEMPIDPGAPAALFSSLSLRKLADSLSRMGHSVEVSNTAGLFVCNFIYFQALRWMEQNNRSTKCVFVHVPYCQRQIENKPEGTPFMELTAMENCIADLIGLFGAELS